MAKATERFMAGFPFEHWRNHTTRSLPDYAPPTLGRPAKQRSKRLYADLPTAEGIPKHICLRESRIANGNPRS